jgi:hypothetical protein
MNEKDFIADWNTIPFSISFNILCRWNTVIFKQNDATDCLTTHRARIWFARSTNTAVASVTLIAESAVDRTWCTLDCVIWNTKIANTLNMWPQLNTTITLLLIWQCRPKLPACSEVMAVEIGFERFIKACLYSSKTWRYAFHTSKGEMYYLRVDLRVRLLHLH